MLTDQSLRYYRDSVAEEVGVTPTGVKPTAPGASCSPQTCCVPLAVLRALGISPNPAPPARIHSTFGLQSVTACFTSPLPLQAADLDGEIDLSTCYDVTEYPVQRNYGFQIHVRPTWGGGRVRWLSRAPALGAGWLQGARGGAGGACSAALSRALLSPDEGRGVHPLCHDVWHPPQLDSDHHEARSPHHCPRRNKVRGGVPGPCGGLVCCAGVTPLSSSSSFLLAEPVCPWKLRLFLSSLSLGLVWIRFVGMLIMLSYSLTCARFKEG